MSSLVDRMESMKKARSSSKKTTKKTTRKTTRKQPIPLAESEAFLEATLTEEAKASVALDGETQVVGGSDFQKNDLVGWHEGGSKHYGRCTEIKNGIATIRYGGGAGAYTAKRELPVEEVWLYTPKRARE